MGVLVQSVERAAEILNCFKYSEELGISEISKEMNLNKSTVFGLVNTLVKYGFLEQTENKKYRLGFTLFEFGNLVISRVDLRDETKRICAPLIEKYPATLHIAAQSQGEVIYLDKLEKPNSFISTSNIGMRAPMYCTGVGKALLAFLGEDYAKEYVFSKPMKKLTENTITTKKELLAVLEDVRKSGIAYDREEVEEGLQCIAAPIFRKDGTPELAISLSFPFGRINSTDIEEVKKDILSCTKQLSAKLGYRG